jgi:hypothetical protein
MIIKDLKKESREGRARISALLRWEDCVRPDHELYFETTEEFAEDLVLSPHPFLVGSVTPAMHFGEKRIRLESEVCPELLQGLTAVMSWISCWFGHPVPTLETGVKKKMDKKNERAAFFFSGGVDSYAILRANHLGFPEEHPWRIRDGIVVFGLEQDDPAVFERVRGSLKKAADDIGITLVPVYTNIYLNYRNEDRGYAFWFYKFQGAALASVAHALSRRITVASIASDYGVADQWPHGSDPRLDPNFSSAELRIRHDGVSLTRFERIKLIADWEPAIKHLRICNQYRRYGEEMFNCGRCEKCVRTMLALLSLGVLEKTDAFPTKDVLPDMLRNVNRRTYPHYVDLLAPLSTRGRADLVDAINRKLAECDKREKTDRLKTRIKEFDSKYFKGKIRRINNLLSPKKA